MSSIFTHLQNYFPIIQSYLNNDNTVNDIKGLYKAILMDESGKIQKYLKANPSTDITTPMSGAEFSLLRMAFYHDYSGPIEELLKHGFIVNEEDVEEGFMYAIDAGHHQAVIAVLSEDLMNMNNLDSINGCPIGISYLRLAIQKLSETIHQAENNNNCFTHTVRDRFVEERQDMVSALILKNSFQINVQNQQDGKTILHKAAFLGLENVMKELIRAGASPSISIADNFGKLPLDSYQQIHGSQSTQSQEIIKLLTPSK